MVQSIINSALERKPAAGLTRQDLEDEYGVWLDEKDSQGVERYKTFKYDEKKVLKKLEEYWDSYSSVG